MLIHNLAAREPEDVAGRTENDKSRFGLAAMPRWLTLAEYALVQHQRLYPCRRSNTTSSQLLLDRAKPISIGKGQYNPARLVSIDWIASEQ